MIHDAKVEVTCDGERCTENVFLEPEYVYQSYNGGGGHYDTRDKSLFKLLVDEGWTVTDEEKTFCESCAEKQP